MEAKHHCVICIGPAKNAVLTFCGHLFCWPCLNEWMEYNPHNQLCPICKSRIDKNKIIPIYGQDDPTNNDTRNEIPPRPVGRATETQQRELNDAYVGEVRVIHLPNTHFEVQRILKRALVCVVFAILSRCFFKMIPY